jgi:Lrp/AsnC family transcriptional regulator, leucine-responsive regulatory protein
MHIMALEIEKLLDETGWLLLQELQKNARLSYSELGQRIGLSSPAVAERMRKMEEAGIISGYHVELNMAKVGLPVLAIIRLGSNAGQSCTRIAAQVSEIPEVLECYRVTGNDSVVIKVGAASVDHLERIIDQLGVYGLPTTSLVLSRPMKRRIITHQMLDQQAGGEDVASQNGSSARYYPG